MYKTTEIEQIVLFCTTTMISSFQKFWYLLQASYFPCLTLQLFTKLKLIMFYIDTRVGMTLTDLKKMTIRIDSELCGKTWVVPTNGDCVISSLCK